MKLYVYYTEVGWLSGPGAYKLKAGQYGELLDVYGLYLPPGGYTVAAL